MCKCGRRGQEKVAGTKISLAQWRAMARPEHELIKSEDQRAMGHSNFLVSVFWGLRDFIVAMAIIAISFAPYAKWKQ
jgi:hypothetical protein